MTTVQLNTIDLDFICHEEARRICAKIARCQNCMSMSLKPSMFKGYHISMLCSKKCDLCRLVFDGNKRFMCDLKRETRFRNILFEEKRLYAVSPRKNHTKKKIQATTPVFQRII